MKKFEISVLCDINDEYIGITSTSNATGDDQFYCDITALVFFIVRILSITRNSDIKTNFISALKVGSGWAWSVYPDSLRNYPKTENMSNLELEYDADGSSKKGFTLNFALNESGHTNRFRSRGFGPFGKNVDFASFYLIIAFYDYLQEKYPDESKNEIINKVVNMSVSFMEFAGGKVGTREEYEVVESLPREFIKL